MAEPTNLTDRLSHLRDRKGGSALVRTPGQSPQEPSPPPQKMKNARRERKFAPDYFMIVAYALLAVALGAQLFLLLWLDFFA